MSEDNQRGELDLEGQFLRLKKLLKFEFEFPQIHEKFLEQNRQDNITFLENVETIIDKNYQELCEYCMASSNGCDTLHIRRLSNSMLRTLLRLKNSTMTQFQKLTQNYDRACLESTSHALSSTVDMLSVSHNHCSNEVLDEYNSLRMAYIGEKKAASRLRDIRPYELEYILRIANQQVEKFGIELDMQAILDEFYDSPITLSNDSSSGSQEDSSSNQDSLSDSAGDDRRSRSKLTLTHTNTSSNNRYHSRG